MHVAALLRGPVPHGGGERFLRVCPRPGRDGQAGGRQVDGRDGIWLVARQPCRDPGPEIAAMGHEAVISKAGGHELMPLPRDLARGRSGGWRRSAEPVAGQRRDDHGERVGGVRAMRAGVGEERKDRQVLQERPGPPMGEQERQRPRPAALHVHHVQFLTGDLHALLAQPVEPGLKRLGVKVTPVPEERVQPGARHASFPSWPEVGGLSTVAQAPVELAHSIGVELEAMIGHAHAMLLHESILARSGVLP